MCAMYDREQVGMVDLKVTITSFVIIKRSLGTSPDCIINVSHIHVIVLSVNVNAKQVSFCELNLLYVKVFE